MHWQHYTTVFWELIRTPFQHTELIWGIVPLYFGWLINEITSAKKSYTTAIQTGFSFLWAATHWGFQYFSNNPAKVLQAHPSSLFAVNAMVTFLVFVFGLMALISGLRRRYPRYFSFLGHTRFSNYFMISIFPIQADFLVWSWDRLIAIALFAVPLWLILHFGLSSFRNHPGRFPVRKNR